MGKPEQRKQNRDELSVCQKAFTLLDSATNIVGCPGADTPQ